MSNARRTLYHARLLQLVVEGAVSVLEAAVAVKQGVCIRIGGNGAVKSFKYQRVIVAVAYHKGYNTPVVQIQNGAQINLVDSYPFVPLELGNIGEPFRVWLWCMKISIQHIFSNMLRILGVSGTAVVLVLNSGFNAFDTTDTQHALVIDMNSMVVLQIIPNTPVALVGAFGVDGFDFVRKLVVLCRSLAGFARCPTVIGGSRYAQYPANAANRVMVFFLTLLNRPVFPKLLYLPKASLLSISCNFFKTLFSISA